MTGALTGYDKLNRLTDFRRGTLSDTNADGIMDTITTSSNTVNWSLDAMGNWNYRNGSSRTHNMLNQITSDGMTYDTAGNTTADEDGKTITYDAWNRPRIVKDATGLEVQVYQWDATGRRVDQNGQQFYYSKDWQVLEDDRGVVKRQYVWGLAYVDQMILRDRDASTGGDLGITGSGLDERLYVMQDANWNTTGMLNTSGRGGTIRVRPIRRLHGDEWLVDGSDGFGVCVGVSASGWPVG